LTAEKNTRGLFKGDLKKEELNLNTLGIRIHQRAKGRIELTISSTKPERTREHGKRTVKGNSIRERWEESGRINEIHLNKKVKTREWASTGGVIGDEKVTGLTLKNRGTFDRRSVTTKGGKAKGTWSLLGKKERGM